MTTIWMNILYGSLITIYTIVIHALATRFIMFTANRMKKRTHHIFIYKEIWLSVFVLIMLFAAILEASGWSAIYHHLGATGSFEESLYFSIVTFTTLGYGDITLNSDWRILASIQAAAGILIFGWSTAIIVAVVQKLYFRKI